MASHLGHQVEGPVNDVEIDEHGALVASGQTLFSLRNDGSLHWRSDQIFDVYSIEIAGSSVAVLAGHRFTSWIGIVGALLVMAEVFLEVIEK